MPTDDDMLGFDRIGKFQLRFCTGEVHRRGDRRIDSLQAMLLVVIERLRSRDRY